MAVLRTALIRLGVTMAVLRTALIRLGVAVAVLRTALIRLGVAVAVLRTALVVGLRVAGTIALMGECRVDVNIDGCR